MLKPKHVPRVPSKSRKCDKENAIPRISDLFHPNFHNQVDSCEEFRTNKPTKHPYQECENKERNIRRKFSPSPTPQPEPLHYVPLEGSSHNYESSSQPLKQIRSSRRESECSTDRVIQQSRVVLAELNHHSIASRNHDSSATNAGKPLKIKRNSSSGARSRDGSPEDLSAFTIGMTTGNTTKTHQLIKAPSLKTSQFNISFPLNDKPLSQRGQLIHPPALRPQIPVPSSVGNRGVEVTVNELLSFRCMNFNSKNSPYQSINSNQSAFGGSVNSDQRLNLNKVANSRRQRMKKDKPHDADRDGFAQKDFPACKERHIKVEKPAPAIPVIDFKETIPVRSMVSYKSFGCDPILAKSMSSRREQARKSIEKVQDKIDDDIKKKLLHNATLPRNLGKRSKSGLRGAFVDAPKESKQETYTCTQVEQLMLVSSSTHTLPKEDLLDLLKAKERSKSRPPRSITPRTSKLKLV